MPERTVTVASKIGLHARPAALFVKAAQGLAPEVTLAKKGGAPVSTKSLLAIITLDVGHGDEVLLSAEPGDGAQEAVDRLAGLLESDPHG